jgi:hypothetical protein
MVNKGRKDKGKENLKPKLSLWTKVHGLSETWWHRILSAERGYTYDLPYRVTIHPLSPRLRLRTVKGEGEKGIPWRFEVWTVGFKD